MIGDAGDGTSSVELENRALGFLVLQPGPLAGEATMLAGETSARFQAAGGIAGEMNGQPAGKRRFASAPAVMNHREGGGGHQCEYEQDAEDGFQKFI